MEIEAKYSVADSAVFAALLELRELDGYALRPTGSRDVIDHYDHHFNFGFTTEEKDALYRFLSAL